MFIVILRIGKGSFKCEIENFNLLPLQDMYSLYRNHKRNLISKIRGAKCFKSMNEIKGHRKCMVVVKFLENIEGAVVSPPSLPLVSFAYVPIKN